MNQAVEQFQQKAQRIRVAEGALEAERKRVCGYGSYLLHRWAERRDSDLEQIGPELNNVLDRLKKLRDGVSARSTATTDKFGDPLLTTPEACTDAFGTTLLVERLVHDLPELHRVIIVAVYLNGMGKAEAGEKCGLDPNHVTHRLQDAQQLVGSWALALTKVQIAA